MRGWVAVVVLAFLPFAALSPLASGNLVEPERLMIGLRDFPADLEVGARFYGEEIVYADRNVRFLVIETRTPELVRVRAAADANVRYVEIDQEVPTTANPPNDPYYASQAYLTTIGADRAWSYGGFGNPSVAICMIDVGSDYTTTDLAAGYIGGYDFGDGDADPRNTHLAAHGQMMISVAAATIDNAESMAGVGNASYYVLKARAGNEGSTVDTAPATSSMSWCANATSARVYSMSFGGSTNHTDFYTSLAFAWYHRNQVLVGSSGNSYSQGLVYPGRYPFVLDVTCVSVLGSICKNGDMGSGQELDLAAPAEAVFYARRDNNTVPINGRSSEAAAMVAGAAALLIGEQPTLVNQVVKDLLEETADDITLTPAASGWDNRTGHGMVNVGAAMDLLRPLGTPTCRFVLPTRGATLTGTVNMSAYAYSPGSTIASVNLSVDGVDQGSMTYHTSDIVNDDYYLGNHTYFKSYSTVGLGNGSHTFSIQCKEADLSERTVTRIYPVSN